MIDDGVHVEKDVTQHEGSNLGSVSVGSATEEEKILKGKSMQS